MNNGMYRTECACGCGKECFTYAKDKMGTLPKVYYSKECEGNDKYKKRFDKRFQ